MRPENIGSTFDSFLEEEGLKGLPVQDFLLTHSFAELYEAHGVCARPSADGSKWSLNYDQLAAKSDDPLANQCRGLILRPVTPVTGDGSVVGPTSIVARPMDRFFNAGDVHAAPIDQSTARYQEKLDGTCCILYFDGVKDQWCVATRAVPEADVVFDDEMITPLKTNTFYELFKYSAVQTIRRNHMGHNCIPEWVIFKSWTDSLDKSNTYVFELTSPNNRVVVKYDDYTVTLLAIRETQSGKYIEPIRDYDYYTFVRPKEWTLDSLGTLIEFVNAADPAKLEGAVVIDANYNRQKVKSKAWILASRAKDVVTMSKRGALTSIIDGTVDDVLPLLDKQVVEHIENMRAGLNVQLFDIDSAFNKFKKEPDRKSFALRVQSSGLWQTPLYILYSRKHTRTIDWLQGLSKANKLTDSMLDTMLTSINNWNTFTDK